MASANLSFRTPTAFLDTIRSRDLKGVPNPGATAKRDLGRYYDLLKEGLAQDTSLTPDEVVVLIYYVGTYEGVTTSEKILLAGEVLEDYPIGLSGDFDLAKGDLGQKYQEWSHATRYAFWDAAERYEVLARHGTDKGLTLGMALHQVGLHTYDLPPEILAHIERTPAVVSEKLPGAYLLAAEEEHGDAEDE